MRDWVRDERRWRVGDGASELGRSPDGSPEHDRNSASPLATEPSRELCWGRRRESDVRGECELRREKQWWVYGRFDGGKVDGGPKTESGLCADVAVSFGGIKDVRGEGGKN